MNWRWNARRLFISAFVAVHLTALFVWVLPACPLRHRLSPIARYYTLPLGLWQYWAMFAPDPVRDSVMLEAEAIDSKGLRYNFVFPRIADYTVWEAVPRFRYSKYAANMSADDTELQRKFAARHAIRRLNIPATAFPVDAHLFYQIHPSSSPGEPPTDPMTPPRQHLLSTFHFASMSEVRP